MTDEFSRTPETIKPITQPMSQAIKNYDDVLAAATTQKIALTIPSDLRVDNAWRHRINIKRRK
jgi:hypothetical protein